MIEKVRTCLLRYRPPFSTVPNGQANSAVIVPLSERTGQIWVTFIRRSETVGMHRGQMGFPGGMSEPEDGGDSLRTALRETEEEIGLHSGDIEVTGILSLRPTLKTGLKVLPFVGILPWPYAFSLDEVEVRSIHHAPLKPLARGVLREENPFGLPPPVYPVDGLPVWGLTARIVEELLEVLDPVMDEL
jgi:8-oxo-dGTP pyrophosphatase MutT (NUDIX family)